MTDFTLESMWPQSPLAKFLSFAGYMNGYTALLLIIGAVIGMFLRPAPRNFTLILEGLAMVLLVASTIVAAAYMAEFWSGATSANRFVRVTFWQARMTGYSAIYYWLHFVALLAPQFFWGRRFRRSCVAILMIATMVMTRLWWL